MKKSAKKELWNQALIDSIKAGVVIHASDTQIVACNKMAEEILGIPRNQVLGKYAIDPAWDFIDETGNALPLEQYPVNQVLSKKKPLQNFVAGIRRPDTNKPTWVLVNAELLNDQNGEISEVVITFMDFTEYKLAEEAVHKSEKKFKTLIEAIPDMVWEFDKNEIFTFCSQSYKEILGYEPSELLGKSAYFIMPAGEVEKVREEFEEIKRKRRPFRGLLNINLTKQGKPRWLLSSAAPIIGDDGTYEGYRGIDKDITEIKEREDEKKKLEAQLFQAQKMESVGRLAGGVAHDFNNMLGVIIGYAELAMDKLDPALPVYEDLEQIQNAAQRSLDLTRQLLAFARRQHAMPKVLNLNDTVTMMLNMLRRLIGEDIDLVWLQGANLWLVKIDPSQINQILANLCVNARDAIGGVGKVTIETQNVTLDEDFCADHAEFIPGTYVMLAVSDDGRGMNKATLENLFEPFFTTKQVGEGTGLGLATVYGIVKQNHGFVYVYSEPGQGATFKIYLPRTREAVEVKQEFNAKTKAKGSETILVVEDEESILNLAKIILSQSGYNVLTARTPGEALAKAEQYEGSIHLLVTDVVMPEMNGKKLKAYIEALKPKIKVLFMSGYTANVIMHRGILESDVYFLQKPFSVSSLTNKVREVLDQVKK